MMPELEAPTAVAPPPAWPAAARRVARTAAVMFVGVSAFAFWLLVVAHVWLGARPFGRLVWEPPAGVVEPPRR